MVYNGIIIPSIHDDSKNGDQGWTFPVMYVPKKNAFQNVYFYRSLDIFKEFNQIPVYENSMSKLTIATISGNYSYVCMPMGIINGLATFSRAIHLALQNFILSFCSRMICFLSLTKII